MRDATQGLTLREIIEHVLEHSGLEAFYHSDREGQDRLENLDELVNAAEAFVTIEGFGKDAVACPSTRRASPRPRRAGEGVGAQRSPTRRIPKAARSCRRWRRF